MNWELLTLCLLVFLIISSLAQNYKSGKLGKRQFTNGVIIILCLTIVPMMGYKFWRQGVVVASAEFDPGVAPFTVEVRKVPVPVTHSDHFVVSLFRGQYVVTSFRFFWPGYTPEKVEIKWPCMNHFTVIFDDMYQAECEWSWGKGAAWSVSTPKDGVKAGLGEYYFKPRLAAPQGCPAPSDAGPSTNTAPEK